MTHTPTIQIAYRELASELKGDAAPESPYEFSVRSVCNTDIGVLRERTVSVGDVRINEINASFKRNCKIAVNDEFLDKSLHLCLPLEGTIGGQFEDAAISASLNPRTHHYLFTPGEEYDLLFEKEVKLAHVEFRLPYLNSLLCPNERWSNQLQEKFLKQEVVYSGGSIACRVTNEIIFSILNCPLSGNLRKIFLEAKVLELVALQLEHYRGQETIDSSKGMRKSDRQLMEEVKAFLAANFTHDHSLNSIAATFAINEFKLKRNFKLQFGHTIFDFLFDLKMDHAYRLLRDGNMLVNEVSREVGYKNPNHFTTAFTKKFGVKPSKLRA